MVRTPAGEQRTAEVVLSGDLRRPGRLTVRDLQGWAQHQVQVSFECVSKGVQHHRFEGPLLHDVLTAGQPAFDPARRKDRLRFLVVVSGADGHEVVLSWGEIDPEFGGAPVLLAGRIDGDALDAAGPQLVLPQDRCGARHVSGVVEIRLDGGYRSAGGPGPGR